MAKELVYKVKIIPDDASNKKFAQSVKRGQEQAEKATRDTISEINREIAQLELLEQTGKQSAGQISEAIERLNKDLATAPVQTEKVIRAQKRLLKLQDRLGDSTRGASRATRGFDKAASGANQTLFSFGDIINDAQQFQFGFAQGSRAIGNNIAFMAEQFSGVTNRAGGFRGALKAIGGSLLGPGGLILGINVVVSALTIFGDKLFGTGKKAGEAGKEIEGLTDIITGFTAALKERGVFGDDPFGIAELERQRQELQRSLEQINQQQERFSEGRLQQTINQLKEERANAIQFGGQNISQINAQITFYEGLLGQVGNLEGLEKQINKELDKINKKLRQQEIIRKRINAETEQQIIGVGRADIPTTTQEGVSVFGAGAELERQREEARFAELGTTREQFLRDLAGKEIKIFDEKEKAKTAIQRLEEQARIQLTSQAVQTASALLGAAFGKNKGVAIATTLLETFASAQAAYRSQLTIPTPDAPVRAAAAAALAVAQGLARVATMRKITPENTSADGGGGGAPSATPFASRETPVTERSTRRRFSEFGSQQIQPQPIIIQGDINSVAAAFKIREGEAVIRKRSRG